MSVASELGNDNIDDNVITGDNDESIDDYNDAEIIPGDDDDNESSREDSVSANDNTNLIIDPTDTTLLGMLLVVIDDDDNDDDPDDHNDFRSDPGGISIEDDIGGGECDVCTTPTISYLPPEGQYETVTTLIRPGISVIGDALCIYQNFFNDPISNVQMFHPAILKSSKRTNNGAKSDETYDDGTTVQPLLNTWVSDKVSNSINNNNNNNPISNNINDNDNDTNILTSNIYSERRHNNIGIDNNTITTIDLNINGATSNHANNSSGNSSPEINCFYDIPDGSQHAKARMNMEMMCIVVDSTKYNGEGVRKCSHYNNNNTINNKNTNTISTTPKHSKVEVEVGVTDEYVATNDSISLFKTTPGRENVEVWVKVVFDFIAITTSNKSCEHQYEWSNNNTNISTT